MRFFGAYGPYEPLRKITTRFLTAVKRGDREFTLRGDGRNLIDFMYVDDAVDGLLASARRAARHAGDRRLRVGSSGRDRRDRRDRWRRSPASDIAIEHDGATAEYIEFRSGDRTMADRFGVVPRISFDDGFRGCRRSSRRMNDAAVRG